MKWQVYSIGKPSLDYARRGIEEYSKRLRRYVRLEILSLREAGAEKNSHNLLEASRGAYRIVLDERGEALTTRQLAEQTAQWQLDGPKRIAWMIGGADGHTDEMRETADRVWTLSPLTLQHELALVVLLEQMYRVHTFLKGEPYHRD